MTSVNRMLGRLIRRMQSDEGTSAEAGGCAGRLPQ